MPKAAQTNTTSTRAALAGSSAPYSSEGAESVPIASASAALASSGAPAVDLRAGPSDELDPAVLLAPNDPVSADIATPNTAINVPPSWRVYRVDFQGHAVYVGVTKRSLEHRMAAHDSMARLRPQLGGPGSLAALIRTAYDLGLRFREAFRITLLAETHSPAEARRLEIDCISRLGTAAPAGCNLMPGGASLGGPANAVPVVVNHPTSGSVRYGSLMQAVEDTNAVRVGAGKQALGLYTVYARQHMGWPLEEALGLKPHRDGRRERPAFRYRGRRYSSLRSLSRATGVRISTARSRLHRARLAGCGPEHDVAEDRRRAGSRRTGGARLGRQPSLVLPDPRRPGETVNAREFADLAGVPHSSVLYRYQQLIRRGENPARMARSTLLQALTQPQDRRKVITLVVPGGRRLTDGVLALIRKVSGDPLLNSRRDEQLSPSGIKRRLRSIPGWPDCDPDEAAVRWAFGFAPASSPKPRAAPLASQRLSPRR